MWPAFALIAGLIGFLAGWFYASLTKQERYLLLRAIVRFALAWGIVLGIVGVMAWAGYLQTAP